MIASAVVGQWQTFTVYTGMFVIIFIGGVIFNILSRRKKKQ